MNPLQGKVLIVDDESSIRQALRSSLQSLGFEVAEASTGESCTTFAGKRAVRRCAPGHQHARFGRHGDVPRNPPEIARLGILMLTVRDEEKTRLRLDAGADDYVTKPFHVRTGGAHSRRRTAVSNTFH